MWKRLLAVTLLAVTVACSTMPQTPAQTAFALHGTYAQALSVAVAYRKLPSCDTPSDPPNRICSSPDVVKKLQDLDNVAYNTLTSAQTIVRDPLFDSTAANSAITLASRAIMIFLEFAKSLRVS